MIPKQNGKTSLLPPAHHSSFLRRPRRHRPPPLDPFSPPEFELIRSLIINSNPSTNFTFQYVALADPTKQSVLSWLSNPKTPPPPRRAIATVHFNKATHEILIDLHKKTVISNRVYSGPAYAPYTFEEQFAAAVPPALRGGNEKKRAEIGRGDYWFRDRYVVPIPKADGTEYRESKLNLPFLPPLNGVKMLQPDGPSFKVNAHSIREL
ncbi:unnamed protein product [Citrullus colocynthis]|uniref:Amine oxidase n=1 Tax=Citrullus colocynthis TaxID=252529 RepID=A0ABP0ZAK6_9ROSI